MKIRIDRTKWDRNNAKILNKLEFQSALFVKERNAGCCLGHIVSQVCNVPLESLDGIFMPNGFFSDKLAIPPELDFLFVDKGADIMGNSYIAYLAAAINDYKGISDEERDEGADIMGNSDIAYTASEINDDKGISDEEREAELIKLFAGHNIELEFFN